MGLFQDEFAQELDLEISREEGDQNVSVPYAIVRKEDHFSHCFNATRTIKNKIFNDFGEAVEYSQFNTLAIRTGHNRSHEGEHSEAIYATSSYVYSNCKESSEAFAPGSTGNVYSRFTNPTVKTFETRLAALEKSESAIGTASGMAALLSLCVTFLQANDHIVCSRNIFGSSLILIRNYFQKFNVEVTVVGLTDYKGWERAIAKKSPRFIFCETPSNPTLEVVNLARLSELARASGALFFVDNTLCTPCSQNPILFGADIVLHSTSKYIDGHGRCIGGALAGRKDLIDQLNSFMRCAGPAMTAENAWVFLKGLETLDLRVRQHSYNAGELAAWLSNHPKIRSVFYTGLESHPQHQMACQQQKYHGGVLSFLVNGGQKEAWRFIDNTRMMSLTTNIGDSKSMITHPASTTHCRISTEERMAMGVSDSLVRISVGLEDIEDIIKDVELGLSYI